MIADLVAKARQGFDAALEAAAPARAMAPALAGLETPPDAILAIGKAAAAMARACREHGLQAPGLIITNPENAVAVEGFSLISGGHPVPDDGSLNGAEAAITLVEGLGEGQHLLVLLSGGGSALMAKPIGDLTLNHKRLINEALLASGQDIHRMNAVRRLFSAVKGGRLAALAAPARVTQWVLSDVPGDHLASIASGPFAPDPWSFDEALACVSEAGIDQYDWAREALTAMEGGLLPTPLRPDDPVFERVESQVLASNALCVNAAAESLGGAVQPLPELTGDALAMGRLLARHIKATAAPFCGVTGGETVVTLPRDHGLGGRSQALALSFLLAMQNADFDWVLLAGGTDGRDGPTDAAGGLVTSAMAIDRDKAEAALNSHDSNPFLASIGGLLHCPPTGTNLADIALVLTAPRG
ncbi:MAG: glycerate kinase type-2 family protein [Candidatus Puniceispirillales bacterium]